MKDPAFLFYSQDFLAGTLIMPFEDRGKYITLLCFQHQNGRMSEETIRLLVGSFSDTLRLKFKRDNSGFFYNERLEFEISKRTQFIESRVNNGKLGGRPKKPTHNLPENENEDENYVVILKNAEEKFEVFRKIYNGRKNGLEVEFENFIKKNKPDIVELLLPALEKEIQYKESLKLQNGFCPEWKNLSTWINQKCWTQELPDIIPKTNGQSVKYLTWSEVEKRCSSNFPSSNFEMVNTAEGKRWILKQPQTQN